MEPFGLTSEEVQTSRELHGDNRLSELKRESFGDKLKNNFRDPMIRILCVALGINIVFVILGHTEWYEAVGIAAAIILAVFVSTYSEYNNENAFQKLQAEAARILCKAYRDGEVTEIPIDDIVAGECILLQAGDKVPADGVMADGNIRVDQSVLNGETAEAEKLVPPEDYTDEGEALDFLNSYKVFRGSVVVSGNGVMRVTTVGDGSVYGQIAAELQQEDDRMSPLKVKLSDLAGKISKFGYIGGVTIALALLFQRVFMHNGFDSARIAMYFSEPLNFTGDLLNAVMLAVIIIVMAVPEGLPLMIAIVSSLNMGKMLKDNVLVRKITGIETAGSLNILFSDKTGTITKGKLETVMFIDGECREYKAMGDISEGLKNVLGQCVINSTNAVITGEGDACRVLGGNATERAVLAFAGLHCGPKAKALSFIPFNSDNKYSAATIDGPERVTMIKGAPERILDRCSYYYGENGKRFNFRDVERTAVETRINRLAARAIRVLALATADDPIADGALPAHGGWALIGIMGIRDEVRPESVTAIREVQNAGVQVVMITGDRRDTAIAIAADAGLLKSETDIVLTSGELADMTDDEIKEILPDLRVVARALPSDKSRLVRLSQERGLVVGMTGDGVNDSPALKKADVGFAMGGGTEVAKEAGDIVILDDNFNSIDKAILYGRTIFNSIRKFIQFQLTINVSAVLVSFVMPLFGLDAPLTIIQILWVNLAIDTLAAIAFGGEPALARYMEERPKSRDEAFVSPEMWRTILIGSIWALALSVFFLLGRDIHGVFRAAADNRYLLTGYFSFFIFFAVFNAFNARTDRIELMDNIKKNRGFLRIFLLIAVIQVAMTYLGGAVLRCFGLTAGEWLFVLGLAVTIIPIDLFRKHALKDREKAVKP